jgi:signal transduction histidine kinase
MPHPIAKSCIAVLLLGLFFALLPIADRPLSRLNAFFPSLDAIVFVTSLVTSVLIFAQFSIFHSRPLLILAGGYLFVALIAIPHALTFAGAFSSTGLLGAGIQTGSWLYIFWHFGFVAALLVYAVFPEKERTVPEESAAPAIGLTAAVTIVVVSGLGWLAIAETHLLPPLIVEQTKIGPWAHYLIGFTIVVSAITLIVLWFRTRSLLDQWLMVVVWACILELIFSGLLAHARFSLGFYAGRIFSLVTASILLIVYLSETTRLYVGLARANALLQHQRDNKLMNLDAVTAFVSHEMRQPLSAISANSAAAIEMLNHAEPDLEEARSAIGDVSNDAMRAEEVLEGTRALFGKIVAKQEPVDVNDMVLRTLRLLRQTFVDHGVRTNAKLASEIRPLRGVRGQLQEVLINLFQNAIDAMDTVNEDHRILTA